MSEGPPTWASAPTHLPRPINGIALPALTAIPTPALAGLPPPTIFDEDWWLDAAAPGAWDRVTVEWDGALVGAMAFHLRHRFGFTYLRMPHLTRTMSPQIAAPPARPATLVAHNQAIVRELVQKLPRHDRFERSLNPHCASAQGFVHANLAVTHMYTFRSQPGATPEDMLNAIEPETRRIIAKAARECAIEHSLDIDRFIRLHRQNHGEASTVDYDILLRLFTAALKRAQAEIIYVLRPDGSDMAALVLVWDQYVAYAWLLARAAIGAHRGATGLLVLESLRVASGQGRILDLDGYVRPEVGVFMMKFGFVPVVRPFVNGATPLWRCTRAATSLLRPRRGDQHYRV